MGTFCGEALALLPAGHESRVIPAARRAGPPGAFRAAFRARSATFQLQRRTRRLHGMIRWRVDVTGAVQGVGFRPFVHRLAAELGLAGWVRNSGDGAEIEVESDDARRLRRFVSRLQGELPPHASIATLECGVIPPKGKGPPEFRIVPSSPGLSGNGTAEVLPDLATCGACLAEMSDPADRRHGYPFINCTHCGPRFSIVSSVPYDRGNTTMRAFGMCDACRDEYETPGDRRFHAQPIACPECGPQLAWLNRSGTAEAERDAALEKAACAIEAGQIVAVKGIGGFHLFADARNAGAVDRLRRRKCRPAKALALMLPSLAAARGVAEVSGLEAGWLASTAAPIVLLRRRAGCRLPEALAPGNPEIGVMLPYSPLHHLLLRRLAFPVVATSGNRGDEPICTDNSEAVVRLRGIADGFLAHDRPIARSVDDSVLRIVLGRELVLRRSRGFVPAPVRVAWPGLAASHPVLACGGDLKATVAVAHRGIVRLSQHLGDLAAPSSRAAFARNLEDFPTLCGAKPAGIACDFHPSYHSHQVAVAHALPAIPVRHHHAHAVACAAENGIGEDTPFLAVVWDGTGHGDDGTIWGGEFLVCRGAHYRRFAWLRPFPLPGGEKAVRDCRFAALGCLHAAGMDVATTPLAEALTPEELRISRAMMARGVHSPLTSSAGRLFDAVAALCGLCFHNTFEGQAAMALQFAASPLLPATADAQSLSHGVAVAATGGEIDWTPLLKGIVADLVEEGRGGGVVALRFHLALAGLVAAVAGRAGCEVVALTGGCFQNPLLLEQAIARLRASGHRTIWHRRVPPNDGGLAFGQAIIASLPPLPAPDQPRIPAGHDV